MLSRRLTSFAGSHSYWGVLGDHSKRLDYACVLQADLRARPEMAPLTRGLIQSRLPRVSSFIGGLSGLGCELWSLILEISSAQPALGTPPEPSFLPFFFLKNKLKKNKNKKKINKFLFIFWLHWVFVAACGLFLAVASGVYSSLRCVGFSLRWPLLLQSTGSRAQAQ